MYKRLFFWKKTILLFVVMGTLLFLTSCSLYNEVKDHPLVFVAKESNSSDPEFSRLNAAFGDAMKDSAVKSAADNMNSALCSDSKESNLFMESESVIVDVITLNIKASDTEDYEADYRNTVKNNISLIKNYTDAVKNKMNKDNMEIVIIYKDIDNSPVYQEKIK